MKGGQTMKIALLGATFAAILYASSGHAEPANYITSDCHQGDCVRYYLVKTFPSPPSAYPPFSTDQYLALWFRMRSGRTSAGGERRTPPRGAASASVNTPPQHDGENSRHLD